MDAPERDDEESGEATAREQLRRSSEAAKEVARAGLDALRIGGKNVGQRSKKAVDAGKESVESGYRTVTLKSYRDEVDQALQQMVDVLAAQDAELRSLRDRVAALEDAEQGDVEA